ncbi:unannotated protein [freshwater metagenome]|uniref:Unannotated protein n=1 Tax=freshwater metagenome TaxID=449393 RepID=A0A6J7L7Z9_9ZZZZ
MPRCITRSPTTREWSARCRTQALSHMTTSPGDHAWAWTFSGRTLCAKSAATVRSVSSAVMSVIAAQRAGVVRKSPMRPVSGCGRKTGCHAAASSPSSSCTPVTTCSMLRPSSVPRRSPGSVSYARCWFENSVSPPSAGMCTARSAV